MSGRLLNWDPSFLVSWYAIGGEFQVQGGVE